MQIIRQEMKLKYEIQCHAFIKYENKSEEINSIHRLNSLKRSIRNQTSVFNG